MVQNSTIKAKYFVDLKGLKKTYLQSLLQKRNWNLTKKKLNNFYSLMYLFCFWF